MEDTLRESFNDALAAGGVKGLNPYSNGRYSTRLKNINPSLLTSYNSFKTKKSHNSLKKQAFSKGLQRYK